MGLLNDPVEKTPARRMLILSDGFPPHDRGGAERIAYYHARALRDLGWEVGVLTSYPAVSNAAASVAEEEPGIRVYRSFPLNPIARTGEPGLLDRALLLGTTLQNPFMRKVLEDAIEDFNPDLIHAHCIARISHSMFADVAPGLKRVITFHGYQFECPKGGLYRKRRGAICEDKPLICQAFRDQVTRKFSNVDRIVAISRFIEGRLADAGHPPVKIRYVPNGVPSLESRPQSSAAANSSFLYVGRLAANKGVLELIEAFQSLDAEGAKLVIVGSGEFLPECEAAAVGDDRIQFTGWQTPEQVAEHYRDARVVVVPSLWHEVMNTVICEAQSWSRPVVATRVGGNSDLIIDGESGFVCEPGDADALKRSMQTLWDDGPLVDRMGAEGFTHVSQYSMERHVRGLLDVYAELGISEPGIE
jgi:glycosyltransferase involved in cell wall biosynthesis